MIVEGCGAQGDAPEQADDGSNTDIYLNMSGDGIEPPSIQVHKRSSQQANYIVSLQLCVSDSFRLTLSIL